MLELMLTLIFLSLGAIALYAMIRAEYGYGRKLIWYSVAFVTGTPFVVATFLLLAFDPS